jgi:hypothetical protein
VWFSARDIELLATGPKPVKPHVLTMNDIANEFARLIDPEEVKQKHCSSEEHFATEVSSEGMGPVLFVFDNLETVITPIEVFKWLDERIRRPNKVLITTRHREFKGDYPIEVGGMSDDECEKLIQSTSIRMGIEPLLTSKYKRSLIQESEGHPYVIKVLLGEVATSGKAVSVKRIMATRENILTALFERTYSNLTPAAQRIFLTLSSWSSDVPLIALQAVRLSEMDERIDVSKAVGELQRYSFVESVDVERDTGKEELFVGVPLAAGIFGKGKLQVSPWKSAVEREIRLLQEFGTTQRSGVHKGIVPHIRKFLRYVSAQISKDNTSLDGYILGRLKTPIFGRLSCPRFEPVFFHLPREVPILVRNTEILALQTVQKRSKTPVTYDYALRAGNVSKLKQMGELFNSELNLVTHCFRCVFSLLFENQPALSA